MTEGVPHLLNVTFSKLPDKSKFETHKFIPQAISLGGWFDYEQYII
jgi:hypothetical protein